MNIFSEIYGTYFRITAKLLEKEEITDNDINKIIAEEGFQDSVLFLPKKLIPQKDGSDWGLLKQIKQAKQVKQVKQAADGSYIRVTKHKPPKIMTSLQKSWLRAKLRDPKLRLFLSDDTIAALDKRLSEVKPLYRQEHFRYTDRFSDGDDYLNENYRRNFRAVLKAVRSREILEIEFTSGHSRRVHSYFLPLKIEYSPKNDKFRIYCHSVKNGKLSGSGIINIGRIESVTGTGIFYDKNISLEKFFADRKCSEPAVVRISTERNGTERFLMEFAAYEKNTERDTATGSCTVRLWYDKQDETELLIRLLSFGPVIEILSPPELRRQAAQRVNRQYELLFGKNGQE